ncbi:Uncharacterised protein [Vibrio cholerae]|nr:Uncharacterised protein [Vibrio cholerae]
MDFGADRIAFFFQLADQLVKRSHFIDIRAEEIVVFNLIPIHFINRDLPHLRQVSTHFNAKLLLQVFFGNRSRRNTHGGFTCR